MDASTPRKNPVDARRARKKSLDARRLQISLLGPNQMEYLRKSFPDSEHHYLSVTNEHASAKLVGVTKSCLGWPKRYLGDTDADASKSVDARRGEIFPLDARRLLKKACRRGRF